MVSPTQDTDPAMCIAFAGGGTGGHLYPALAVAEAIHERSPTTSFVFFSTHRDIDYHILGSAPCAVVTQVLPPLSSRPWKWPAMLWGYHRASNVCRERLRGDRPDVVIGTGGLSSVPALRLSLRMGITTALLNPDAIPGKANKLLAGRADLIVAQWQESAAHFPRHARVKVLGCPVRKCFGEITREYGIKTFNLSPERKTLLVTGASQGARTLNEAVVAASDIFEKNDQWQILHLTGHAEFERVRGAYEHRDVSAQVVAYTDEMAAAIACADLIVSRAGASTLAEITAVGRASILLPYPYHKDMHQAVNAKCLVDRGAASVLTDQIDPAKNGPALRCMLDRLLNDSNARAAMASAAKKMGRPNAAGVVADEILALARSRRSGVRTCETMEPTCSTTR